MINVNRRFLRIAIGTKLIIAFCLIGLMPVAVVWGYGALKSFQLMGGAFADRLKTEVVTKAEEIERLLQGVEGDILFLSRLPSLQAIINIPPQSKEARSQLVTRLGKEFLSLSRSHRAYYQIRYIDELGREIVRIESDGHQHSLVPSDRLQDKSDRYYFREAQAVAPGTVYVSPMDLNIEWGAVEILQTPVVRYAVPLQNIQGQPRGIVAINLHASQILNQVLTLKRGLGEVALASSAGFYLTRSGWTRTEQGTALPVDLSFPTWLASYSERLRPSQVSGPRPEEQLWTSFPQRLAARILSGQPGTLAEPGLQGRIVGFAPIFPYPDRKGEFWVLIHSYSKADILSSIRSLQVLVLSLGGVVLLVALGMGVAVARHITRPIAELIRGAEAVAQGDFDRPIKVDTNDELEDLSRQFTWMATHLKEHERQLREAREQAELKAQEAQVLCRIGTEILALLSLPQILQLVVDKAREIMKGDLAILCLEEPGVGLRVGATSGPSEVLSLRPGEPVGAIECLKVASQEAHCPVAHEIQLPTHIAVPLRSRGRVVGDLCLGYRVARVVNQDEMKFLEGLANQAAIAIENARLHREVRELALLEERERIAGDLHDGIIQSIYATGLGLEECARLIDEDPLKVKSQLEGAIQNLNTVIRDVRNYIGGLQPEGLQEWGLSRSIADFARRLTHHTLLGAELKVEPGIDGALAPEQTGHLFQICREALTNVVKHSGASRVVLRLGKANGVLRFSVKDNGKGFDPAYRSASGQGLRNIEERTRRLGGSLRIEGAPGCGTQITVEIPLEEVA